MKRQAQAVSPFSTGGGGTRFELLVAVSYLVKLLRQEVPRGVPDGIVQEVHLQQRNPNYGNPVDDIVVDCRAPGGQKKLYLQVKHSIAFSKNADFLKVIEETWRQLSGPNFTLDCDGVGLAIGEVSNNMTVRRHAADILDWAKTSSNARAFHDKVSAFSQKLSVLNAFEEGLRKALGRGPTQKQAWTLLRHFVVVPFDFTTRAGRDTVDCHNLLIDSVESRDPRHASGLYTILYAMASEYAVHAGDITREALSDRISSHATFAVPVLQRAGEGIAEILSKRLRNRIAAEKNSKKYIPQVFVEVGDIKDRARLFCHPLLFLRKVIDRIAQLDMFELRRLMTKTGLKPVELQIASERLVGTYDSLDHDAQYLTERLQNLEASLSDLKQIRRSQIAKRVPREKQHVLCEIDHRIGYAAAGLADGAVKPLLADLEVVRARVLAVVSRAGQGKTNFVCDFAENCLAKRQIPCALFTGKELGGVGRGQLSSYVAQVIYGAKFSATLESLLVDIDAEASRKSTAGIILVDAINEHPDLRVFSQELETFIEKCLEYPHVRVMLTCRSEFFNARFGNLTRSSFADRLVAEKEIHEQMGHGHRERLIEGYFTFFKIRPTSISEHVRKQLTEDPFLLRVFCEAHGNPAAKSQISVGRLRHIRREALFREYFNRKLGALGTRAAITTGFLVGTRHPYQELLLAIVTWMVDRRQFSDVSTTVFTSEQWGCLAELIDEDILIRRDLATDSILGTREVINFTFDACRDFLLADHLLNIVLPRNASEFQGLVHELTDEQSTVAEGLQQYLFYASRHRKEPSAVSIIRAESWYDTVFADCIFDLDDKDVTKEDTEKLRSMCLTGGPCAPWVACGLLVNYDPARSTHANINVLFDVFDAMTDVDFADLCRRAFGAGSASAPHLGIYRIDDLVEDIRKVILPATRAWCSGVTELARLLLYLWDIPGRAHPYPARHLFHELSCEHPRVAARLQREHTEKRRKGYPSAHCSLDDILREVVP